MSVPEPKSADVVQPRVQRKRLARIDRILTVATEEIGRRGHANTSLDVIAERLDVTKASLYYYFDSKEALLRACLELVARQSITAIEEAAAAGGRPFERLRGLVVTQLRYLLTYPEIARLFVDESSWPEALEGQIRSWRERHARPFRATIDEGVAVGDFDVADPAIAHLCLMGAMNSVLSWPRRRRPTDAYLAQVADELMRLVSRRRTH
jgi:AcrR family transcriptional regulator